MVVFDRNLKAGAPDAFRSQLAEPQISGVDLHKLLERLNQPTAELQPAA